MSMTAETLRKSILQYAIEGQLLPQNPEDEPVSILLDKIYAEKFRLKKDRVVSTIYREEGRYYENKNGQTIDITDEIPFDIPETWVWTRIGDAYDVTMGQSPKGNTITEENKGIEFHQGKIFFGHQYLLPSSKRTTAPTKIIDREAVLLCVRAPVGEVNIVNRRICIGRGLCAISSSFNSVKFLYYVLFAIKNDFVKQATGSTFTEISCNIVKNQLLPLPPFAEQERIVGELERLEPLFAEYECLEKELLNLDANIHGKLWKSILQHAIEGKLLPQNSEDESADVLLNDIAEKKRSVHYGRNIGSEKNTSHIYKGSDGHYYEQIGKAIKNVDEDLEIDIPDSWRWARLKDFCLSLFSGKSPVYSKSRTSHKVIGQQANKWEGINLDYCKYCTDEFAASMPDYFYLQNGDVLLNTLGNGTLGRSGIYLDSVSDESILTDGHLFIFRCGSLYSSKYLLIYLKSIYDKIVKSANGTTNQTFLSLTTASQWLIPVPPLEEQKRIVEEIEKYESLLDGLGELV